MPIYDKRKYFPEKISRSAQEEPRINKTLNFDLKEKPKRLWSYIIIKFDFRFYGSVNSSCAEPAPQPPGLLWGICPPCKSRGWGTLKFHGIKDKALEWIKSWLTNRTQTIVSNGRINLQGSSCDVWSTPRTILGPLMFL